MCFQKDSIMYQRLISYRSCVPKDSIMYQKIQSCTKRFHLDYNPFILGSGQRNQISQLDCDFEAGLWAPGWVMDGVICCRNISPKEEYSTKDCYHRVGSSGPQPSSILFIRVCRPAKGPNYLLRRPVNLDEWTVDSPLD